MRFAYFATCSGVIVFSLTLAYDSRVRDTKRLIAHNEKQKGIDARASAAAYLEKLISHTKLHIGKTHRIDDTLITREQ